MPANFLIVCGGSGRGILNDFDMLGFDGALQIDEQQELIRIYDSRILQFALPISRAYEPTPNSVEILQSYCVRLEEQWKQSHSKQQHVGDYSKCLDESCVNFKKQITHVVTAVNGIVPANILASRSQSPIISRSYITRPRVSQTLADTIRHMSSLKPAHEQDVVVWLVASTCGGTGNGIVHHVSDVVKELFVDLRLKIKFIRIGDLSYQSIVPNANMVTFWAVLTDYGYKKRHQRQDIDDARNGVKSSEIEFYYIDLPNVINNTQLREQFVRSAFVAFANPHLDEEFVARLNNFGGVVLARVGEWGNAFDKNAVYHLTLRQLKQKLEVLLYPREAVMLVEIQSFNITAIASLNTDEVRTRCTSVVNDTKNEAFLTSLTSIGDEFNTVNNINDLQLHPRWQLMRDVVAKIFDDSEVQAIRHEVQISMVINNETVNINLGGNLENVSDRYVGSAEHIQRIRIAQRVKVKLVQYLIGNTDIKGHINTVLRDKWNGLVAVKKMKTGFAIIDGLFTENKDRQDAFNAGIIAFLHEYFKVARCLEILEEAESIIADAKKRLSNVVIVVDREIQNTTVNISLEFIFCAELEEVIYGSNTWVQQLMQAITHDIGVAIQRGVFRKEIEQGSIDLVTLVDAQHQDTAWVHKLLQILMNDIDVRIQSGEFHKIVEMGVIGLTEHGLKYKLQVPLEMSLAQLVALINTRVGSSNPVWWQGTDVQVSTSYGWLDIRRFPRLPDQVFKSLQKENDAWGLSTNQRTPLYVCSDSLAMGLDIYAVQGTISSINEEEQITQLIRHAYALSPNRAEYRQDVQAYVATQCARSIGLPIRVPKALMNVPHIQAIMTTMANYLVIDQS